MTKNVKHMSVAERIENGLLEKPDNWDIYSPPTQPMNVARSLISDCFTTPDGAPLLVYWRDDFWYFTGICWSRFGKKGIRRPLYERLEKVCYTHQRNGIAPWAPDRAKISNVLETLEILTERDDNMTPPFRMDGDRNIPVSGVIAMRNGLLDLETKKLSDHDPAIFNTWQLPFDYDPDATCPRWEEFLSEVFGHDPAAPRALQQYAGVLVTGDTTQHKALALIGAKRGGKGTISYVLQQLVGVDNVATTSLNDLGGDFGLSPLIGKTTTVLEDARAGNRATTNLVTERILNLVANDSVSVNRKNRDYWNGRLNTRLILVSNEIPRLPDSSGAILTRFLTIKLVRTFKPEEQDPNLKEKLVSELPGIFQWALRGYDDLLQEGSFTQPETAADIESTFEDLSNPLQVFIDEGNCFEVTGNPKDFMPMSDVLRAYRAWAQTESRASMGREALAQAITAAYPMVSHKNTRLSHAGEYDKDAPKRRYLVGVKPINNFGTFPPQLRT